jgi:hypothetical protein
MFEVITNLHSHTRYSDGEGWHRDITVAAAQAGINAVAVTDHNVFVQNIEGYYDGVLLIVGEEVHDCLRRPQSNHCLMLGASEGLSPFATPPQRMIDEARQRGAMAFAAHPYDYAGPIDYDLGGYPWTEWEIKGLTGIEIWNYMTELKRCLWNYPIAFLAITFPSWFILGPFKETLRKWDELTMAGRRVVAIGNADAHASVVRKAFLKRVVFDYAYLFRCVNTHILIEKPLKGNVVSDKAQILSALRAGHCFVGYDLSTPTQGFTFTARSGADTFVMGDEFRRRGAVTFRVNCPAIGSIRLLRNGKPILRTLGRQLEYNTVEPGVYRVEVYRPFRLFNRGWIFSNPIYVR